MLTDFGRLGLLLLVCFGGGWLLNRVRSHPLPLAYRTPGQRMNAGLRTLVPHADSAEASLSAIMPRAIDLNEFQTFVAAGKGLVVDARANEFFRQSHVPGAVNLPRETFAAAYARQSRSLEARRTGEIAIYCSEADCSDSTLVAEALAKLGFQHLLIYKEGWEEWNQAGLAQEKSPVP